MLLGSLLPTYDFREFHQTRVRAPASCVFRAVKELTPHELPMMRILMAISFLPTRLISRSRLAVFSGRSVLKEFVAAGFLILADQHDQEIVVGRIGQFWKLVSGESPRIADSGAFISFNRGGFGRWPRISSWKGVRTAQLL
jgi:hypothetical protein